MSHTTIGIVTGANKGIGLAIVRQLALQYPSSPLNKNNTLLIYLTARDPSRGAAALQTLQQDPQLKQAKALATDGGATEVKFHVLDITSEDSVKSFAGYVEKEHGNERSGGIDFIVNNAGIALEGFDSTVVQKTLHCNYYSTLHTCHTFLPLLKPTGRIVNVASAAGHLDKYAPTVRNRFFTSRSEEDVTGIMRDFASAVAAGRQSDAGFPSAAYAVSKAGLVGATRALARSESKSEAGKKRLVNSCCPGYVDTDMTKGRGTKTTDQGAQTPVLLAIGDIGGRTGEFWQSEKVIEW